MKTRVARFLQIMTVALACAVSGVRAQQGALNSITAEDLRMHLKFVAADETEGRDTPSAGVNIVARYLAVTAERYGLKPVMPDGSFFQNVPLEVTAVSAAQSHLRVISEGGEEVFYYPHSFGGSFRSPGTWAGEAVFVGYGLSAPDKGWDDYGDLDITGKIVIMLEGSLPEGHALRADRALQAARMSVPRARGAAAILTVISPERENDLAARGTGFQAAQRTVMRASYPTQNRALPTAAPQAARKQQPAPPAVPLPAAEIRHRVASAILGVSGQELAAMFGALARGEQVPHRALDRRVELSVVTERRAAASPNVLAMMEGSDPTLRNEYVVVSSHHDHLGMRNGRPMDGADDNGSGTVAMLEIAQALALERPKRSVILAWFTGEEKGLLGSHYFVNNCPVPLEKISANLNLDMISRNDPDSLYLIGSDKLSTELDEAIRKANERTARLRFDYTYNDRTHPDRFYYRSDHYPFIRVGIPAVWFFCGTTADYHQTTDTLERVDFAKMEKATRLAYLTALDIGNKPELLRLNANPEVKTRGKHNTAVESIR